MKILFCFFLMCIATGTVTYLLITRQQKKIGVIDAVRLFDGFGMKTELEGIAKHKLLAESKEIDSVKNDLQMAKAMNNDEEIKKQTNLSNYLESRLEEDYKQSNLDINDKIWKRLNPLIDEFGKKKGLHLIIGANGMGSVLYNDDYYDLTNEAIKYVNKRYAEGD